jgi:hypothetical protein
MDFSRYLKHAAINGIIEPILAIRKVRARPDEAISHEQTGSNHAT